MTTKRSPISLPFFLAVIVLGVVAYFSGPWIMTQVMYQQEKAKAGADAIRTDVPEGRPSIPTMGGGEPGSDTRVPEGSDTREEAPEPDDEEKAEEEGNAETNPDT